MTDILVIGGGIAGLSAAARLSETAQVTVVEAENVLGYHASGRSAAMLEVNYGAPSVQALSGASVDYLSTHDGGYLSPRGLMILAKAHEEDAFATDCAEMAIDRISIETACAMVPVLDRRSVCYAGYHGDAQDIDTDRLLQGYLHQVRANDGRVLTSHRVTGLRKAQGGWEIDAGGATPLRARIVVNAAGAWADGIAQSAGIQPLGIMPHRRSMARIPAPQGLDVSDWPMIFGVGESWYAKPDAGALLVSPADEDPVEPHDAWAEELTLAKGLARYEGMVTEPVTRLLSSWAGLRSFAPDRTLVLGPDPSEPTFVWCAAQGGYGVQTSPAASQLVADLVMGRAPSLSPEVVAQLKPDRLR